jgi:lipopolysaccharide export system permease protein
MYLIPLATGYLSIRQLVGNKRLEIPLTWEQKLNEILVRLRLAKVARPSDGNQSA